MSDENQAVEVSEIATELPEAELVFAFVSPLGTPTNTLQEALTSALKEHGYDVGTLVRLSQLLDEADETPENEQPSQRQERLMEAGTKLRESHGGDHLARLAVAAINRDRIDGGGGENKPTWKQARIVRSLKHPDEVARLRHVYGEGFFLIGASASQTVRLNHLVDQDFQKNEAKRLLAKDAADETKKGQQTRRTFELADAFVRLDDAASVAGKVQRLVDLVFSCPFLPPTNDEHAMFMAYSAALRSSDLSRQVGAVVVSDHGDVMGSGANEPPAAHGHRYAPEMMGFDASTSETAGPDFKRGYDSNERERNEILVRVLRSLGVSGIPPDEELGSERRAEIVMQHDEKLRDTGILDLTEFGRAVHAEMSALMSCGRIGASTVRSTLFCTTFPCHNCAKHIVAAGVRRVVYVEPYPKSRARALHADAIAFPDEEQVVEGDPRVLFEAFEGVGPRRFVDLFSLNLGSGRPLRRKKKDADGARLAWERGIDSLPRLALDPRSYLDRESAEAQIFLQAQAKDEIIRKDGGGTDDPEDAAKPDTQGNP